MRDDRRPEIMVERSTAPATREVPPRRGLGSGGWNLYLVAMAGLVPIVLPAIVQSLGRGGSLSDQLLGSRLRAAATFYNPNMLADYLMLSVFMLLGLGREVRRWFFALSLGLLLLALLSTKSNGGMISLGVGLAVWAAARSLARGLAPVRLGGALCL